MKSKSVILLLLPLLFACNEINNAPKSNQSQPFVIDNAHLLLPTQAAHLDSLYTKYKAKTGNTVRLLTIYDVEPAKDLHSYALHYFDSSGLGLKNNKQHLLIVYCTSCQGIQILSGNRDNRAGNSAIDSIVKNIMIPDFSIAADYKGLLDGSNAIISLLENRDEKGR